MSPETFLTIDRPGFAETRVLGSRFFGHAVTIASLGELPLFVDAERVKFHDATHWCFAARTGIQNITERMSDAGEPKGTAGQPILQEISGRGLTNCAVIISRYFGGQKLGTGNLARAYAECAAGALENSHIVERHILVRLIAECSYDDQGIIYHAAGRFHAIVEPRTSAQLAVFELRVSRNLVSLLCDVLRDESSGRIVIEEGGIWIS